MDELIIPESVLAEMERQAPRLVLWLTDIPAGLVILPDNRSNEETAVTWLAALGLERPFLAKAIKAAARVKELRGLQSDLTGQLEILEHRPRCNGWIVYRDDGATYAHHGITSPPCPTHGALKHGTARGLRKYIGKVKVQAAETAVKNEKALITVAAWLNDVEREIENWEQWRQQPFVFRTDLDKMRDGMARLNRVGGDARD